jgi:hypothetical protein
MTKRTNKIFQKRRFQNVLGRQMGAFGGYRCSSWRQSRKRRKEWLASTWMKLKETPALQSKDSVCPFAFTFYSTDPSAQC